MPKQSCGNNNFGKYCAQKNAIHELLTIMYLFLVSLSLSLSLYKYRAIRTVSRRRRHYIFQKNRHINKKYLGSIYSYFIFIYPVSKFTDFLHGSQ